MCDSKNSQLEVHISVYKLYIDRIVHEGNLIWSRFKIYLSLNAGAFAAVGLVVKPAADDVSEAHLITFPLIVLISIVGWRLSLAWKQVSLDGSKWQRFITGRIAELENNISLEGVNLYTQIVEEIKGGLILPAILSRT